MYQLHIIFEQTQLISHMFKSGMPLLEQNTFSNSAGELKAGLTTENKQTFFAVISKKKEETKHKKWGKVLITNYEYIYGSILYTFKKNVLNCKFSFSSSPSRGYTV